MFDFTSHKVLAFQAKAQRLYADILEAEGKLDWAEFYRAKAEGHPAFTLQAYQASKKK